MGISNIIVIEILKKVTYIYFLLNIFIILGGILMKIHWKGKLDNTNHFPKSYIPSNANILLDDKNSLLDHSAIIVILVVLYFAIRIKRNTYPEFRIDLFGFFIGAVFTLILLPIHELIHCLFCPKDTHINIYYSLYGITSYPLTALSKWRYIVVVMAPTILMGLIPLTLVILLPIKSIFISSIIFTLSILSLSSMTIDIRNAILTIIKVPTNGYIQASGNKVYWFE